MADYSKFDNILDSDDEDEAVQKKAEEKERRQQAKAEEERSRHTERRIDIDRWMKPRVTRLLRDAHPEDGPPELDALGALPMRSVTNDERNTLAMFVAVTHCGRNDTNIERHHDIMNLARQNRWLEEDPGTLELLCQVHRLALKEASEVGAMSDANQEMSEMLISAINTLSAPSRAGCKEGYGKIYDLFAMISEPVTKNHWDIRERYTKKEYAAEALLDSMAPNLNDDSEESNGAIIWCLVALVIGLLAAAMGLYLVFFRQGGGGGAAVGLETLDPAALSPLPPGQQEL